MASILKPAVPSAVRFVEPVRSADPYRDMDLLRFSTAGSVDDGKSTLIGRLLYDTKSIFADQLAAIESASRRRGDESINLALLTDGLRAEREQNITIDVAYRYFATPRRKFIIADTPGHLQYTRNMVTGASTADLAIVLVDARKGVVTQSRRHAFISTLLGIPHLVVAVNKMDLVNYSEDAFRHIMGEFTDFASKLDVKDVVVIPMSALHGDNVVERSRHMPWYEGSTLLHHLETVNVAVDRNLLDFRFPVQYVIRPHQDYRGLAGRVASGTIRPGEEVVVLPSGQSSRIGSVEVAGAAVAEAAAGDCVVLTLEDAIDVGRGDLVVRRKNLPDVGTHIDAQLCWMSEQPLITGQEYVFMQNTRTVRAVVQKSVYRIDVDTLHREPDAPLGLNDIGRVQLVTAQPVCFDAYNRNAETGSFILIDPYSNATIAAGIVRGAVRDVADVAVEPASAASAAGAVWEPWNIGREEREARNRHQAAVVWFTGLSGSGKSTIARAVERELFELGTSTMLLDGDQLRHGLNADLGFAPADRAENIRRVGEVARLFFEQGAIVLCTFVSPYRADRDRVRSLLPAGRFIEVFVDCSVEEFARRDTKGLYEKSRIGQLADLTGVTAPYEAPPAPELTLDTTKQDLDTSTKAVMQLLRNAGLLSS